VGEEREEVVVICETGGEMIIIMGNLAINKRGLITYYFLTLILLVFGFVGLTSDNLNSGYISGFCIGAGPFMFIFSLVYHWKYYKRVGKFF
jgi:hypothetical protein